MPDSRGDLTVRSAGPDDADVVLGIYVDSWNAGFGARMPRIVADRSRLERWRTGVGSRLMLVALDGLRADGYRLGVLWTLARYPRGEGFYITHGWRRNGASRRSGEEVRYDNYLQPGL